MKFCVSQLSLQIQQYHTPVSLTDYQIPNPIPNCQYHESLPVKSQLKPGKSQLFITEMELIIAAKTEWLIPGYLR